MTHQPLHREIVHLDLFSGAGGFPEGFRRAGYTIKRHYFSEIDKHAIANYRYNFKTAEYVGSVTDVRGRDLPEQPTVITFGSPCQDFSLAGKRRGLGGERSSLIEHAIRLVTECRPDVFIWENVKGAFSSNNGADFWPIIQAFANIGGYRLEWQLLNTAWFLPQHRERIYLIGHLGTGGGRDVFPFGETIGETDGQNRFAGWVHNLQPRSGDPTKGGTGLLSKSDGYSYAIDTGCTQCVQLDKEFRFFTEIECERLQGFDTSWRDGTQPRNWTKWGIYDPTKPDQVKEISRTQRYKLIGNAVTVDVVAVIANRL